MVIKKIVIMVKQDEDMDWRLLREDLITTVETHKLKPFTTSIIESPDKCKRGLF